jgi:hypothetical protein
MSDDRSACGRGGLDGPDRADVPDVGDIALSRSVTGDRDMPCPPECFEHYAAGDGRRWMNHSAAPRWVTSADASHEHEVVNLGVWLEVREHLDHVEPTEVVGVISKEGKGDAEMSAAQMRNFALHVLAVANRVDQLTAERQLPIRVSAVSETSGLLPVEARAAAIGGRKVLLHAGMEDLMLEPADARALGEALIRLAG